MAHTEAQLPLPVFQLNQLTHGGHVEPFVPHLAAVAPVLVQTSEITQRLKGEQIVGSGAEVVQAQVQTVVQQTGIQAHVQAAGGLPLNLVVANTIERESRSTVVALHVLTCTEIATGSIVVDIIVAADVVAGRQAQVVDAGNGGHPGFIADYPRCLYAWENAPTHTEQLHASLLAEARRAFDRQVHLGIVATQIVIVGLRIVSQRVPILGRANGLGLGQA